MSRKEQGSTHTHTHTQSDQKVAAWPQRSLRCRLTKATWQINEQNCKL